jgi:hypothetical protein
MMFPKTIVLLLQITRPVVLAIPAPSGSIASSSSLASAKAPMLVHCNNTSRDVGYMPPMELSCEADNQKLAPVDSVRLCFDKITNITKEGKDFDTMCDTTVDLCDDLGLPDDQQVTLWSENTEGEKIPCIYFYWAIVGLITKCHAETELGISYGGKSFETKRTGAALIT